MTTHASSADAALVAAASLAGAAGVGLAALAAHHTSTPGMAAAAEILMIHAAAVIALSAWMRTLARAGLTRIASWGLLFGAVLFSSAVSLPALGVMAPIPLAAPAGGTMMILAWLAIALVTMGQAVINSRRSEIDTDKGAS